MNVNVTPPKLDLSSPETSAHSRAHACSSPVSAPLLPTLTVPISYLSPSLCIQSQRGPSKTQGQELAAKLPRWSRGSVSVPNEREGFQRNAFFLSFFFELGNELIIVYRGSVILDPSNGAKA